MPLLPRRYIPILKDFPNRYIYEPWNAPEAVQKAANCVVGVDYPKPMINHAEGSRLNIERMKQVYQQLSHYRGLSKSAPPTRPPLLAAGNPAPTSGPGRPPGVRADHPGGGGATDDRRAAEQQRPRWESAPVAPGGPPRRG